jgi:predicted DNA-binding transcriptional regulator YafY
LRGGQRLFRVDRIAQIELTSETFPPRVNFSALEAVQRALAAVPRAWPIEVWLETTLEEAQRQMRLPETFFEEAAGGTLFRMEVDDLPWAARLLAGLGVQFVVHRPRELCDVLRQYARTLASYAKRSEV